MNILLHGDNEVAIAQKKDEVKASFSPEQIWEFDGKVVAPEQLAQALGAQSLFGENKQLVIIENLAANKTLAEDFIAPSSEISLLLVESKKLSPTLLAALTKVLPEVQILEYKVNTAVFRFVESLGKQGGAAGRIFAKELTTEAPEIIFSMVVRQLRLLLLLDAGAQEGPDEWKRLSPWQKQRLAEQLHFFSPGSLGTHYQKLLELDGQLKTGQFPGTSKEAIQFFLLGL